MIERKFIAQNLKEYAIKQFIATKLSRVGLSDIKLKRTPLGDKIVISTLRPGLVVGRAGSTINMLTEKLKEEFKLNNPQIELEEVKDPYKDADIVVETIVNSLERFGSKRFKGVGHKVISAVIKSGALGVEILISGKVPSSRAKTWRFYQGYLKKCGDISVSGVNKAQGFARLKSGVVGVQVSILPADVVLPDSIKIKDAITEVVEEVAETKLSDAQKAILTKLESENKIVDKKDKSSSKSKSKSKPKKKKTQDISEKKSKPKKKSTDSKNSIEENSNKNKKVNTDKEVKEDNTPKNDTKEIEEKNKIKTEDVDKKE